MILSSKAATEDGSEYKEKSAEGTEVTGIVRNDDIVKNSQQKYTTLQEGGEEEEIEMREGGMSDQNFRSGDTRLHQSSFNSPHNDDPFNFV